MKMKLSGSSIRDFFVNHVEKMLFGAAILVLLLLAYGAIGRESINFEPQKLVDESQSAQQFIRDQKPTPVVIEQDIARKVQVQIKRPVQVSPYAVEGTLSKPMFRYAEKRREPPLLPVEDLRAEAGVGAVRGGMTSSGSGMMGSMDPMSGMMGGMMPGTEGGGYMSDPYGAEGMGGPAGPAGKGVRYVVLTGLLPYVKQREAFKATFENSEPREVNKDTPQYLFYYVERAEVTGYEDDATLARKFKPISSPGLEQQKSLRLYASTQMDVVGPQYLFGATGSYGGYGGYGSGSMESYDMGSMSMEMSSGSGYGSEMMMSGMAYPGATTKPKVDINQFKVPMAFPLPQLVGKQWGEEAAHLPEIPLMPKSQREMLAAWRKTMEEAKAKQEAEGGAVEGQAEAEGQAAAPSAQSAVEDLLSKPVPRPGMPGSMPGMPPGMSMPGYSGYASGMSGYSGSMMPGTPGMPGMKEPDHKLFRYVDFNVESGKKYQYRVQVYLVNPNYGLEPRFLAKPDLGDKQYVVTGASKPSTVARVPFDASILAGPVRATRNVAVEPTASVVLKYIHMENGAEQLNKFDIARGNLLNYPQQKLTAGQRPQMGYGSSPYGTEGSSEMMYGMPGMSMPSARDRKKKKDEEEEKKVDLETNMVVVDLAGGASLGGDLTEPGKILLMDMDGNLLVQDELEDAEEYAKYKDPVKEKKKTQLPPGMSGAEGSGYMQEMMMSMPGGSGP